MNETFIILSCIGMVFLVMSYLIRYKNMIDVINYCDETEVCDLNGFKIALIENSTSFSPSFMVLFACGENGNGELT